MATKAFFILTLVVALSALLGDMTFTSSVFAGPSTSCC